MSNLLNFASPFEFGSFLFGAKTRKSGRKTRKSTRRSRKVRKSTRKVRKSTRRSRKVRKSTRRKSSRKSRGRKRNGHRFGSDSTPAPSDTGLVTINEFGPGYQGMTSYPNGYLPYFGQDVPKETPSNWWGPNLVPQ